ncbi:hypothetical protein O181_059524 [Austropuccinia psidii MF-1]|uniref:DUF4939 domain-containing protein n=1 Tax=Austropuccinia psidii MF-1 TaxID=1389203 RepID=A0A9Q3EEF6_9BASI|nr:hypothetical protein [Austropuccinia psidii MF-1]
MPVQHSPPAKNTKSQIHKAVLTPTARAPLDHTPSVHQLGANLDRGPPIVEQHPLEEEVSRSEEAEDEEGEESVEEEESEETELASTLEAEPNFLRMMEHMTQFIGKITQEVAPRDTSKAPEFKTPSMKAPHSFDGTKAYKMGEFIQYCKLIFHNDPENLFSERKKVLYSTSFLTGRTGKWIEPYLSNISNKDPS